MAKNFFLKNHKGGYHEKFSKNENLEIFHDTPPYEFFKKKLAIARFSHLSRVIP